MLKLSLIILTIHLQLASMELAVQPNNMISNLLESFHGSNNLNFTHLLSMLKMPDCLKKCMPDFGNLMKNLDYNSAADKGALQEICRKLQESSKCAAQIGCSGIFADATKHTFDLACKGNWQDFNTSTRCVIDAAEDLQQECEQHCHVQGNMISQAAENKMEEMVAMKSMCNASVCLLHCFHKRVGDRCEGPSTLIDDILASLIRGKGTGFERAITWLLPEACNTETSTTPSTFSAGTKKEPISVGRTDSKANSIRKRGLDLEFVDELGVETSLLVDGEFRSLQCQMYDWQHNPVNTPDFEDIAKMVQAQSLPITKDSALPTALPSEKDLFEAESRVNDKIKRSVKDGEVRADRTHIPEKTANSPFLTSEADNILSSFFHVGVLLILYFV